MRTSCTLVAVPWLVTFFKQTEQGTLTVLGSGAHHRIGLTAEVVGRNRVRWSAAQLSNESALPRTSDSTQIKNLDRLDDGPGWKS